jgi:transposase-like protein
MQPDCPKCGRPLLKRGKSPDGKPRFHCKYCHYVPVKTVKDEDFKLVKKAIASTLQKRLKVIGEQA